MPWWLVIITAIINVLPNILPKEGGEVPDEEKLKELVEHIKSFKK